MEFARKETTVATPMTSPLVSLPWYAGIISEDAVLMEIVAGKKVSLTILYGNHLTLESLSSKFTERQKMLEVFPLSFQLQKFIK